MMRNNSRLLKICILGVMALFLVPGVFADFVNPYKFSIKNTAGEEIFYIDENGDMCNHGSKYEFNFVPTSNPSGCDDGCFRIDSADGEAVFVVNNTGDVRMSAEHYYDPSYGDGYLRLYQGVTNFPEDCINPQDVDHNFIVRDRNGETVACIRGTEPYYVYLKGDVVACGDESKILQIFTTNSLYNGNLGGLSGADQFCINSAAAGGIGGAAYFIAWLSDETTDARDRFDNYMEGFQFIRRGDPEKKLVSNGLPLDGFIFHPLNINESGMVIPDEQYGSSKDNSVFTGTNASGIKIASSHCNSWTNSSGVNVQTGVINEWDGEWTEATFWNTYYSNTCGKFINNYVSRLYCFCSDARCSLDPPPPG